MAKKKKKKISFLFKSKTISKDSRLELIAKGTKKELKSKFPDADKNMIQTEKLVKDKNWYVAFEEDNDEGVYVESCGSEEDAQKALKNLVIEDYPEDEQEAIMASCGLIFQA